MNVWILIYLFIITYIRENCGNNLFFKFANDEYPYQVIILSSNLSNVNVSFQNFVLQTIFLMTPTISIDLATIQNSDYDRFLQLPALKNPRFSTLYVILENENEEDTYLNRVHDVLHQLVRFAPVPTRPKCLLLLWSMKNIFFIDHLKRILLQAWSLKFLDFTIFKFRNLDHASVITYNPFTNKHTSNNIEDITNIFPDKLRDMNGYPLKLAVFNDSFFLSVVQNPNNGTTSVSGLHYPFFEIFSRKLNFTQDFIIHDSSNYSALLERLYLQLDKSEINVVPILMISTMVFGNNHTLGRAIIDSKLVMIIPILSTPKVLIDSSVLVILLVFPIIMIILAATAFCLKLDRGNWQPLNVIQLLVGMSSSAGQPRRSVERFIFFATVVAAMKYSSDVFATLTNVKLVNNEMAFNTIEEILDSGLPIYGIKRMMKGSHDDIAKVIQSISSSSDCVKLLLKTHRVICLSAITNARMIMRLYHGRESGMKLAKPSFQYDFAAFPFERASPYRERMDEIALRVLESGIMDQWIRNNVMKRRTERRLKMVVRETKEEILLVKLGVVLVVGYFVAAVVFVVELIKKRNKTMLSITL